jgi:hypothetical protein
MKTCYLRRKHSFAQNIPSKPARYDTKIFALIHFCALHAHNVEVYVNKLIALEVLSDFLHPYLVHAETWQPTIGPPGRVDRKVIYVLSYMLKKKAVWTQLKKCALLTMLHKHPPVPMIMLHSTLDLAATNARRTIKSKQHWIEMIIFENSWAKTSAKTAGIMSCFPDFSRC